MPPRKLDELAAIVDDAKTTIEELQDSEHDAASKHDAADKLAELHHSLEEAAETVDELEEKRDGRKRVVPAARRARRRRR